MQHETKDAKFEIYHAKGKICKFRSDNSESENGLFAGASFADSEFFFDHLRLIHLIKILSTLRHGVVSPRHTFHWDLPYRGTVFHLELPIVASPRARI
jgi:hypothetical protein